MVRKQTLSKAEDAKTVQVESGSRRWRVQFDPGQLLAERGPSARPVIEDIPAAVRDAIANPIDFPPLEQAIYPDDRVVFVVDGAPQAFRPVLLPLIEMALRRGAPRESMTILAPPRARQLAPKQGQFPVRVQFHDPSDRAQVCYLASTEEGERIYLNRTLVDADVVIAVGAVRYDPVLGHRGTSSGLFPALSTTESYERLVKGFTGQRLGQPAEWTRRYVEQIGWLLGLQIAVQLVQGQRGEVIGVLAGQVDAVQKRAVEILDACCRVSVPRRADAALVTIGRQGRQTLADLARALHVASRVVRRHGDLVVLSEVAGELGPAMEFSRKAENPEDVLRFLRQQVPPDAVTAYLIASACSHARVYLASDLPHELVEELFMFPVEDEEHVERILSRSRSCIVLHEANVLSVDVEE